MNTGIESEKNASAPEVPQPKTKGAVRTPAKVLIEKAERVLRGKRECMTGIDHRGDGDLADSAQACLCARI